MQRVHSISEIELSKSDTLTKSDLKDMFNHFKSVENLLYGFSGSSCHYGFPTKTGYQSVAFWCHSSFGGHYQKAEVSRGFIDMQTRNLRPKTNKLFMDYLLSETESPWKDALKNVAIVLDDTVVPDLPVACVLTNTKDTPIKVFMNLMVAGRMKPSWGLDYVWNNLVLSGLSKPTSMILSSLFSWNGQTLTTGNAPGKVNCSEKPTGTLTKLGPHMSDQPFYTLQGMFLQDFINSKPSYKPDETLMNDTEPQPCSVIWNRSRKTKDGMYYLDYKHCQQDPTHFLGMSKDMNARGLWDAARHGKVMSSVDIHEIEDSFRSGKYIEV